MGNRDIRISVEGRGMWWGTRGIQDGHYRDFQEVKQLEEKVKREQECQKQLKEEASLVMDITGTFRKESRNFEGGFWVDYRG